MPPGAPASDPNRRGSNMELHQAVLSNMAEDAGGKVVASQLVNRTVNGSYAQVD